MDKKYRIFLFVAGPMVLLLLLVVSVLAAPSIFDWQANPWPLPPRVITRSYFPVGAPDTNFNFAFSGDTSRFLDGPVFSPQTNTVITGGTGEPTLFYGADFEAITESITLTITITPHHAISVSFTLMDIDTNVEGGVTFQDQVLVIGSGSSSGIVTPTLTATNPTHVTVTGNVATSTGTSVDNTTDGANVLVDFGSEAINQIVIVYRPGPLSSANPTGGGIGLHDISFTPASPTSVSFLSLRAQPAADTAVSFLTTGLLLMGVTAVLLIRRRRRYQPH
ncbi:MAG: hypothetical protein KF770_20030 [Anaerolineae bacterium]|nr:hypothetical protein [Anaerolineae bacterium]